MSLLAPYDTATEVFTKLAEALGCSIEELQKIKDVSRCLQGMDRDTKQDMLLTLELLKHCEDHPYIPPDPEFVEFIDTLHLALIQESGLVEISGIQLSLKSDQYAITFEDSGNPDNWQAIDLNNGEVLVNTQIGTYNQVDIEDITTDGTYLYFADTGNNAGGRTVFPIVRVQEPSEADILAGTATTPAHTIQNFTLNAGDPAGTNPDIETLFFLNDRFYIITKRGQTSYVYASPIGMVFGGPDVEFVYIGSIGAANGVPHDNTEGYDAVVIGGDAHGDRVILKTYVGVYETRRLDGQSDEDMIVGQYTEIPAYVGHGSAPDQEPKGEAVSFNDDCIVTISENYAPIINKIVGVPVTTTTYQEGINSYVGCTDTHIDQAAPDTNYVNAVLSDLDDGPDPRHALLHFDNIALPAGHEALGGYLELDIAGAGSGFRLHLLIADLIANFATMTWNNHGAGTGLRSGIDYAAETIGGHGLGTNANNVTAGTLRVPLSKATIEALLANNLGFAYLPIPGGENGMDWATSNNGTAADRPILAIYSTPTA